VAKYVGGCIRCQKAKADKHRRETKLVPMPIAEQPLEEIAMDFIGELLQLEGFNAIFVVNNPFSKVQHYIRAKITCIAAYIADVYIKKIWRLYGLPKHITSDCGPQFTSKFLKELNKKVGITLHLSTAYQPETGELSE